LPLHTIQAFSFTSLTTMTALVLDVVIQGWHSFLMEVFHTVPLVIILCAVVFFNDKYSHSKVLSALEESVHTWVYISNSLVQLDEARPPKVNESKTLCSYSNNHAFVWQHGDTEVSTTALLDFTACVQH